MEDANGVSYRKYWQSKQNIQNRQAIENIDRASYR